MGQSSSQCLFLSTCWLRSLNVAMLFGALQPLYIFYPTRVVGIQLIL